MNQARSEEPLGEAALRARIAAGSEAVDDYLDLADLLRSDARDDEAIRVYEQALSLRLTKTQRAKVLNELGTPLCAEKGERDRARTLAREALDLVAQEPDSFDTLLVRGLSLFRIADLTWGEDPGEAERIGRLALQALEQAIHQGEDPEAMAVAYYTVAWLYSALGDQERAIHLAQRCLQGPLRTRDRPDVLNMLAEALRLAGRLGEAEEAARSALRLMRAGSAELPGILVTLGFIQRAAGRPTDARESFARALQAVMQHQFLRHDRGLLGTIYAHLGEIDYDAREYAKAADSFRQALAQRSEDGRDRHRALIWLGDCHLAMGAKAEARSCYQQVVSSPVAADEERQHARDGLAALPQ